MTQPLHDLTVADLAARLKARDVSAEEVARHFLARSQAAADLGAYLAMDEEATLAQARAADALLAAGNAPALAGVPIAHKDIFVTRDFATTAGSKMLADYRSPFDAKWCANWRARAWSRLASSTAMNSPWARPTKTRPTAW